MQAEHFQIVTSQGQVVNLERPYYLRSLSGISLPGTRDRTTRSPMQDGDTYLGALVEPRVMNMVITVKGRTRGHLGQLRRRLSARLNAKAAPLQLRAFLEDDTRFRLRALSCTGPIQGAISYEGSVLAQNLAFRLIGHSSIWYSDTLRSIGIVATQTEQLVFPAAMGPSGTFFFGTYAVSSLTDLWTLGDWDAAPIITLPTPMDRPRIINTTTGEQIVLNYSISVGEVVYIDTTPGARDIYNNYGERLQKYLEEGDFPSFHLEPDSILAPDGHNFIVIQGSTSGLNINGTFSWYDRYTSI